MAAAQYLVALDKVKARMGYPPNEVGSNPAVYSGMRGAQLRVQSELRTLLIAGTATDTFYLDDSIQSSIVNGRFLLNLSNGFVATSPAPTMSVQGSWGATDTVPLSDAFAIDAERGILQVSAANRLKYVTFTYNYGFTPANVTAGLVPEWLEEILISYTPIVLKVSNTALPQTPTQESVELLLQHIMSVIATKRRNFAMGLSPI